MPDWDKQVVPAKLPQLTGTFIATAGTGAGLYIASQDDDARKLGLGISLVSLAAGAATYKFLNYFTPESKLEKAQALLTKNNNKIQHNSNKRDIWYAASEESIDVDTILNKIPTEYPTATHPETMFLKNDIKPLEDNAKQARRILKRIAKHLGVQLANTSENLEKCRKNDHTSESCDITLYQPSLKEKLENWLNNSDNRIDLLQSLDTANNTITGELERLSRITDVIRKSEKFIEHTDKHDQIKSSKAQRKLNKQQRISLENSNSIFYTTLQSLLANAVFMEKLIAVLRDISKFISGTTNVA